MSYSIDVDVLRQHGVRRLFSRDRDFLSSEAWLRAPLKATLLLNHDFVIIELPYPSAKPIDVSETRGGSPHGAANIAGADGKRMPSDSERKLAHDQDRRVAEIATKLHG